MNDGQSIDTATLVIESGPDKGRTIQVQIGEISLGRSSKNDISLLDPILSRNHCKLALRNGKLTVTDLESANGTLVNDKPVTTAELHIGDRVLIGDTLLLVKTAPSGDSDQAVNSSGDNDAAPADVVIDLGFDDSDTHKKDQEQPKANWRPLIWGIGAIAILALAVSLILRAPDEQKSPRPIPIVEPPLTPLEIIYEKIEASTSTVFRYNMKLDATGMLAVEIDDLSQDRHVRKEDVVSTNRIQRLAKLINDVNFFKLDDTYDGIAPEGVVGTWDITVISNLRAKRVQVLNRTEPDVFRTVREELETFGKNELGIWAIQFSREKLVAMADEAFTRARNLFDERGIAYGNTFEAIKRFQEAAFYLDTVDPKPDFYNAIVTGLADAQSELSTNCEEQRFLADRAINLKDWAEAARELRILREMIPDTDDERNSEAARKLLDVENRLKVKDAK